MLTIFLVVLICCLLGALVAVIRQNRGLEKELADQLSEHATVRAMDRVAHRDELQAQQNEFARQIETQRDVHLQRLQSLRDWAYEIAHERDNAQMNLELVLMTTDPAYNKNNIHNYIKEHAS